MSAVSRNQRLPGVGEQSTMRTITDLPRNSNSPALDSQKRFQPPPIPVMTEQMRIGNMLTNFDQKYKEELVDKLLSLVSEVGKAESEASRNRAYKVLDESNWELEVATEKFLNLASNSINQEWQTIKPKSRPNQLTGEAGYDSETGQDATPTNVQERQVGRGSGNRGRSAGRGAGGGRGRDRDRTRQNNAAGSGPPLEENLNANKVRSFAPFQNADSQTQRAALGKRPPGKMTNQVDSTKEQLNGDSPWDASDSEWAPQAKSTSTGEGGGLKGQPSKIPSLLESSIPERHLVVGSGEFSTGINQIAGSDMARSRGTGTTRGRRGASQAAARGSRGAARGQRSHSHEQHVNALSGDVLSKEDQGDTEDPNFGLWDSTTIGDSICKPSALATEHLKPSRAGEHRKGEASYGKQGSAATAYKPTKKSWAQIVGQAPKPLPPPPVPAPVSPQPPVSTSQNSAQARQPTVTIASNLNAPSTAPALQTGPLASSTGAGTSPLTAAPLGSAQPPPAGHGGPGPTSVSGLTLPIVAHAPPLIPTSDYLSTPHDHTGKSNASGQIKEEEEFSPSEGVTKQFSNSDDITVLTLVPNKSQPPQIGSVPSNTWASNGSEKGEELDQVPEVSNHRAQPTSLISHRSLSHDPGTGSGNLQGSGPTPLSLEKSHSNTGNFQDAFSNMDEFKTTDGNSNERPKVDIRNVQLQRPESFTATSEASKVRGQTGSGPPRASNWSNRTGTAQGVEQNSVRPRVNRARGGPGPRMAPYGSNRPWQQSSGSGTYSEYAGNGTYQSQNTSFRDRDRTTNYGGISDHERDRDRDRDRDRVSIRFDRDRDRERVKAPQEPEPTINRSLKKEPIPPPVPIQAGSIQVVKAGPISRPTGPNSNPSGAGLASMQPMGASVQAVSQGISLGLSGANEFSRMLETSLDMHVDPLTNPDLASGTAFGDTFSSMLPTSLSPHKPPSPPPPPGLDPFAESTDVPITESDENLSRPVELPLEYTSSMASASAFSYSFGYSDLTSGFGPGLSNTSNTAGIAGGLHAGDSAQTAFGLAHVQNTMLGPSGTMSKHSDPSLTPNRGQNVDAPPFTPSTTASGIKFPQQSGVFSTRVIKDKDQEYKDSNDYPNSAFASELSLATGKPEQLLNLGSGSGHPSAFSVPTSIAHHQGQGQAHAHAHQQPYAQQAFSVQKPSPYTGNTLEYDIKQTSLFSPGLQSPHAETRTQFGGHNMGRGPMSAPQFFQQVQESQQRTNSMQSSDPLVDQLNSLTIKDSPGTFSNMNRSLLSNSQNQSVRIQGEDVNSFIAFVGNNTTPKQESSLATGGSRTLSTSNDLYPFDNAQGDSNQAGMGPYSGYSSAIGQATPEGMKQRQQSQQAQQQPTAPMGQQAFLSTAQQKPQAPPQAQSFTEAAPMQHAAQSEAKQASHPAAPIENAPGNRSQQATPAAPAAPAVNTNENLAEVLKMFGNNTAGSENSAGNNAILMQLLAFLMKAPQNATLQSGAAPTGEGAISQVSSARASGEAQSQSQLQPAVQPQEQAHSMALEQPGQLQGRDLANSTQVAQLQAGGANRMKTLMPPSASSAPAGSGSPHIHPVNTPTQGLGQSQPPSQSSHVGPMPASHTNVASNSAPVQMSAQAGAAHSTATVTSIGRPAPSATGDQQTAFGGPTANAGVQGFQATGTGGHSAASGLAESSKVQAQPTQQAVQNIQPTQAPPQNVQYQQFVQTARPAGIEMNRSGQERATGLPPQVQAAGQQPLLISGNSFYGQLGGFSFQPPVTAPPTAQQLAQGAQPPPNPYYFMVPQVAAAQQQPNRFAGANTFALAQAQFGLAPGPAVAAPVGLGSGTNLIGVGMAPAGPSTGTAQRPIITAAPAPGQLGAQAPRQAPQPANVPVQYTGRPRAPPPTF